ncbi:HTH_48 domain-containing protein [Trichonephila clavipes]|nr:HTH_48 domain-containing protein [Trichonephila clavipes]
MGCHCELLETLGNNALPYRRAARRVGKFRQGLVSTSDEQRSRPPVSVWKNWSTHRTFPTFRPVTRFIHDAANAEADGTQCLPCRWQRVVTVTGDYIEGL